MNGILHFLTHFLTQYGPFTFFAVVLVNQIGLPVAAIPFLMIAGGLVGAGHMALGAAVGVTVVIALWGGQFWYQQGRHRGQYLFGKGLGTLLCVGSGIGVGYLFSEQSDLTSLAIQYGPNVALVLLGGVAAYVLYKTWYEYRAGHLVPRLSPVLSERASRVKIQRNV